MTLWLWYNNTAKIELLIGCLTWAATEFKQVSKHLGLNTVNVYWRAFFIIYCIWKSSNSQMSLSIVPSHPTQFGCWVISNSKWDQQNLFLQGLPWEAPGRFTCSHFFRTKMISFKAHLGEGLNSYNIKFSTSFGFSNAVK